MPTVPTVLVTGASRGIGLEFVRQYAADGWDVIAACRDPGSAGELAALSGNGSRIEPVTLDVADGASIERLAAAVAPRPVDLLINNAGIMGALPFADNLHRQHFGSVDYGLWTEVLRTNTLGAVHMAEAFLDLVAASDGRRIISLSSSTGSIAESKRAALAYTTSKAALNKAMTVIAEQVRPRGVTVALLCPGYVKTRMNVGGATVEIPESVAGMRQLIASMTLADSGSFRRYNGETVAW